MLLAVANAFGQQLSFHTAFTKIKAYDGSASAQIPGLHLSLDNLNFEKLPIAAKGIQLSYFPEIYIDDDPSNFAGAGLGRSSKLNVSAYYGKPIRISKTFFLSLVGGGIVGLNSLKGDVRISNSQSEFRTSTQFTYGIKASELLLIRIRRSAISTGFEQWLMINSMNLTFFKIGYSFHLK